MFYAVSAIFQPYNGGILLNLTYSFNIKSFYTFLFDYLSRFGTVLDCDWSDFDSSGIVPRDSRPSRYSS